MIKIKTYLGLILLLLLNVTCSKDETAVQYKLTAQSIPTEGGDISPSTGNFDDGDVISIMAVPKENYKFVEWTGNASGNNNPLSLTINSNKIISAVFEKKDSDSDGVMDDIDTCPNTPTGQSVDSNGCSASQKDSDSDGVMDSLDQCQNTPNGQSVDSNGCSSSQKDTDMDGIKDNVDTCPNTPIGQTVNSSGCSSTQTDSDGDGVMDNVDTCSGTPIGQSVDSSGCSTSQKDTDMDGIKDNVDTCPNTPIGQTVNSSGCSSAQTDSDGDGVMDNLDKCQFTPIGQSVDSNGCTIQLTYIPDNSFEQALIILGYDNVLDDYVLTANISGLTSLVLDNRFISSLIGIEDFKSLTNLDVSSNQLTSIDLSKNTALTILALWDNQLTSIDLSANKYLTNLVLGSNQLTSINLSTNNALTILGLNNNRISNINLSTNTALTYLSLEGNQLTDIDISANRALTVLYLMDNQLTSIDLSSNTVLSYLNLVRNRLTSIDLSAIIDLYSLSLNENSALTCIKVNQKQLVAIPSNWQKDASASYALDCSNPNASIILGIWNLTESLLDSNPVTSQNIVEFNSDNRVKFTYLKYGNNGEDIFEIGSWVINDNNLIITWDEADPGQEIYNLEILELSSTTLKWKTVITGEGTLTETFKK